MVIANKQTGKELKISPVTKGREKLVNLAKAKAEELHLVFYDAIFTNVPILETGGLLKNVMVKLPPAEDKYLKFCPAHQCLVPSQSDCKELSIINVEAHYRRSLPFINGAKVYRNFYMNQDNLGKKVLAHVWVRIKHDYSRNEQSFVFDYYLAEPGAKPEYEITIGTDDGQLQILGTDKFIKVARLAG